MRLRRGEPQTLASVAADLIRHPWRHLVRRWNYKAALTSAAARGLLFFAVNAGAGLEAAQQALVTEFALRFVTSGFYGALTQALSRAEPARHGWLASVIVLPVCGHSLELAVHWARGTANLEASILLSMCLSGLSTSFNIFAMRHGVLTVGESRSTSLLDDLRVLPHVALAFVRAHVPSRPLTSARSTTRLRRRIP
jgi:hypothetical protein